MRISVSKVDAFNYYMGSEYKSLDELRADLEGKAEQTYEMSMGHAFHSIMENMSAGMAADSMTHDDFTFHFTGDIVVPSGGVAEARGELNMRVDGIDVTVRGRADRVIGNSVTDYKLVKRWDSSVYERFFNAFQWRAYLAMFDATDFTYHLFLKRPRRGKPYEVDIPEAHTLRFKRYPGMEKDLEVNLRALIVFARNYLPDWYRKNVGA